MANLRIKLVKSLNGRLDSHIATAQSRGLHKIGNETVQPDHPPPWCRAPLRGRPPPRGARRRRAG